MAISLEEKFELLTGEADEDKVSLFLLLAEQKILEVTNRPEVNDFLKGAQLELAVALYNQNGEEGTSSVNEGGVSHSFLAPEEILRSVKKYTLTPIARRQLDAKKKNEEVQS